MRSWIKITYEERMTSHAGSKILINLTSNRLIHSWSLSTCFGNCLKVIFWMLTCDISCRVSIWLAEVHWLGIGETMKVILMWRDWPWKRALLECLWREFQICTNIVLHLKMLWRIFGEWEHRWHLNRSEARIYIIPGFSELVFLLGFFRGK